jgi:hypothetical protein
MLSALLYLIISSALKTKEVIAEENNAKLESSSLIETFTDDGYLKTYRYPDLTFNKNNKNIPIAINPNLSECKSDVLNYDEINLNDTYCVIDLIKEEYKVIVVSRHYLGSINHTLLTIEALKNRKIDIGGIIFSGSENKASEAIIINKTGVKCIGRIEEEPYFDQNVIKEYADLFRESLLELQ